MKLAPVVSVRTATAGDLDEVVELYRGLSEEMLGLEEMWHRLEALNEPVESALNHIVTDPDQLLLVGFVDGNAGVNQELNHGGLCCRSWIMRRASSQHAPSQIVTV